MKRFTSLVCLFLSVLVSFGQRKLPEFGEADTTELSLKICHFEPDANAMKLFDVQETEYEPSPFGGKIKT